MFKVVLRFQRKLLGSASDRSERTDWREAVDGLEKPRHPAVTIIDERPYVDRAGELAFVMGAATVGAEVVCFSTTSRVRT